MDTNTMSNNEIILQGLQELLRFIDGEQRWVGSCGLCYYIAKLPCASFSKYLIYNYVTQHKPHDYKLPGSQCSNIWGWPPWEVEPRVKWLKEHIEIVKQRIN